MFMIVAVCPPRTPAAPRCRGGPAGLEGSLWRPRRAAPDLFNLLSAGPETGPLEAVVARRPCPRVGGRVVAGDGIDH